MKAQELLRKLVREEIGLKDAASLQLSDALRENRTIGSLDETELARELSACPELRRELASTLSVSESFFFRHPEQAELILAMATRRLRAGERLAVWSAGCSRGEEPYTVALQLLDTFGAGFRPLISILGTDIHGPSLALARAGRYGRWSLRSTPLDVIRRRFSVEGGVYQLAGEVIGWPEFQHLSIQEHLGRLAPGAFDIVLFRNVGIYLTDEALATIHAGFARVLKPDGLLLQSVTDPTPPPSLFAPLAGRTIGSYRLATAADRDQPAAERQARGRPSRPSIPAIRPAAPRLPTPPRFPTPPQVPTVPSVPPEVATRQAELLESASRLADLGRDDDALAALAALLRADTTARDAYFLRAKILLQRGSAAAAADDLRSALLLDPADPLTRYWYVLALETAGRPADAARQRRTVLTQLDAWPAGRLLHDGATTAAMLRALVSDTKA